MGLPFWTGFQISKKVKKEEKTSQKKHDQHVRPYGSIFKLLNTVPMKWPFIKGMAIIIINLRSKP